MYDILLFVHFLHVGVSRIAELTNTVKHLQSQNNEKDASLNTMQISLDRMVGPWEKWGVLHKWVVKGIELGLV